MATAEKLQTDFLIEFPVLKAIERDDGAIEVEGIATDEGLDLESEIVKASGWVDGLAYLEKHGHFNWDHDPNVILGDITKARVVDLDWVEKKFGFRPVGNAVYVKGVVYAPNDEMPEPVQQRLRYARGLLKAGAKLGLSIEGARIKSAVDQIKGHDVLRTQQAVPYAVAISPAPVNARTILRPVRIAKSLSEALMGEGEEAATPVLYVCKGIPEHLEPRSGGQGQGGPRKGDGGSDVCVCPKCGETVPHERGMPCTELTCPKCGERMVGAEEKAQPTLSGAEVAKGLRELVAEAQKLANTYRTGGRGGPDKEDLESAARELDVALADAEASSKKPGRLLRLAQAVARRLRSLVGQRVRKGELLETGYGTDSTKLTGGAALRRSALASGRPARKRRRTKGRSSNGGRQVVAGADVAKAMRDLMALLKARHTKRDRGRWARAVAHGAKPGSGERFEALVQDIKERGDVRDPEAVAAAIGRRKYGKKRFQQMTAAGRKRN